MSVVLGAGLSLAVVALVVLPAFSLPVPRCPACRGRVNRSGSCQRCGADLERESY